MNEITQQPRDHRFVLGLFTGTFIGAGLAMWLAPHASEKYQQASAHVGRKVADFTQRGRDVRDDIAGAILTGAGDQTLPAAEVASAAMRSKRTARSQLTP